MDCWGDNQYGELGDGSITGPDCSGTCSLNPVAVSGLQQTSAITCALVSGGAVYCWGDNSREQLGDCDTPWLNPMDTPTRMWEDGCPDPTTGQGGWQTTGEAALGAGGYTSCISKPWIDLDTTRCTGTYLPTVFADNESGSGEAVLYGSRNAQSVSTAEDHGCAVRTDGSVNCWGYNDYGQFGDGTVTPATNADTLLPFAELSSSLAALPLPATAVASGAAYSCALETDETVACWGRNNLGQLGNNTLSSSTTPVQVTGLPT